MRELDINILLHSDVAKQGLAEVDQALESTAVKATTMGTAVTAANTTLEQGAAKTSAYRQQVLEAAGGMDVFKVSTVEMDRYLSDLHVSLQKLPTTFTGIRGGLNDIATGAGLTFEGLGLVNAAGLAIGVGYAAWGIGRAIADFTGADAAIAKATATLVGWGNVSAQEAGAKQDVINLAIRRGADVMISYSEAIKFNTEKQKEWLAAAQEANDAVARLDAPAKSAKEVRDWNLEIDKVRSAGVIRGLTADLDSHNFSQKELAERYKISTGAIALFQRQLTETEAKWKSYDAFAKEVMSRVEAQEKKAAAEALATTREILAVTRDITKEYDAHLAKHEAIILKLQTEASLAEFKAKQENMAQFGVDENGAPLGLANDPGTKAQKDLDALKRGAASDPRLAGISTSEREQQINNQFLKAQLDAAKAADTFSQAGLKAAAAADGVSKSDLGASQAGDTLSKAHTGAVQVSGLLAGAFGSAAAAAGSFITQLNMKTNDPADPRYFGTDTQGSVARTLYAGGAGGYTATEAATLAGGGFINFAASGANKRAAGGPTRAGETYLVGEKGPELWTAGSDGHVTPNSQMGGGVSIGDIIIQGNVDSRATADRLASQVADRVFQKIQGQRKVQLGRA